MESRQTLRGFLANIDMIPPLVFTFQFNPTSITDNKLVNYADTPGDPAYAPRKTYTGGGARSISFDFKLNALEQGMNVLIPVGIDNGITTELAKLRSFVYPKEDALALIGSLFGGDDEGGKKLTAPPTCYFGFGTKILECVLTELSIQETQFNSTLAPVAADVSVKLHVVEEADNTLYEVDKAHRIVMAALGLQNVSIF